MLHRQCKVNGKLKTSKRHSLCIGNAALPKILLFVRLWRDFVVNLWVNWNLGCLYFVELFSISRLQRASPQSVRAVSVLHAKHLRKYCFSVFFPATVSNDPYQNKFNHASAISWPIFGRTNSLHVHVWEMCVKCTCVARSDFAEFRQRFSISAARFADQEC